MQKDIGSTKWCFTINNYSDSDTFAVRHMLSKPNVKYGIFGFEVGEEEKTPHIQGYVRFRSTVGFNAMAHKLVRARLERANGDDMQNKKYCSKDDNHEEYGEAEESKQGSRNDIKAVSQLIRSGEIEQTDFMFDYPEMYVRYGRMFDRMFAEVAPKRTTEPNIIWRYGLSGTGKTRHIFDNHDNVYVKDNTLWWDGYKSGDVILIDDFDNNIPYRVLLRILDRYQYQGQIKGGYVQVNSPHIYITCEFPPTHYWCGNELLQITRRLSSIVHVGEKKANGEPNLFRS